MSMPSFKAFKKLSTAREFAKGGPVVRFGDLYLATDATDQVLVALTSINIIVPNGNVSATVTLRHLERLGNANHAEANPKWSFNSGMKAFTPEMFK